MRTRRRRRHSRPGFGETLQQHQVQRGWAFDEGRFGLKVWFRRRWCPRGFRPPWIVEDQYEWLWLYAAVEPLRGESFFLLLPRVTTECLQLFVDALAQEVGEQPIGLVLDGSGSHRADDLRWPEQIHPLPLPRYSPELNPAEQIFRHLRAKLANRIFEDLDDLETAITEELRVFWEQPAVLRRLTAYPWWRKGLQDINSVPS